MNNIQQNILTTLFLFGIVVLTDRAEAQLPVFPTPTPDIDQILEAERIKRDRAQIKSDNRTLEIIEGILKRRDVKKQLAIQEIELTNSKISEVDREKKKKILELQRLKSELELRNESKKFVTGQFSPQNAESGRYEKVSKRVSQIRKVNGRRVSTLVNNLVGSDEIIKSGRGLNILLRILGPVAEQHEYSINTLSGKVANLKRMVALHTQVPEYGKGLSESQQELYRAEQELRLIQQLKGADFLTPKKFGILVLQKGEQRSSLSATADQLGFRIDWQTFAQVVDFDYKKFKKYIEEYQEKALNEIRKDGFMSGETLKSLAIGIDSLDRSLEKHYHRNIKDSADSQQQKKHFFGRVRYEIRRIRRDFDKLSMAKTVEELQLKPFNGTTINDLLAYMSKNHLTFYYQPQRSVAVEQLHHEIYKEMVHFYLELQALRTSNESVAQLEKDITNEQRSAADKIKDLEEREKFLVNVKYESYLDLVEQVVKIKNPVQDSNSNSKGSSSDSGGKGTLANIKEGAEQELGAAIVRALEDLLMGDE